MKKLLLLSFCLIAFVISNAQVDVSTGGPVITYPTLSAAFNAISSGTHTGAILINITSSTSETATATLEPSGLNAANYTSILIYPTVSGCTISWLSPGPNDTLIHLRGADNITIDGRVNRTGARDLTLWNNASAGAGNFVVCFTNDATFDTVMYCTVKGQHIAASSTTSGLIAFGTASAGGNDNNVIDNCDIDGMSNSTILVNSNGTSGNQNSGIIISNNLLHDFYLGSGVTTGTGGVRFGAQNDQITVTGNSLYQTATRAYSGSTNSHSWIEFNSTAGNGHVISKNYLGGSAPFCGGSPFTVTGGAFRFFGGISLTVGTTTATRVDSNVIRNMDITSAFATAGSSIFLGYYVTAGAVNFTRDTVGASTGTNSIVVTATANTGALFVGFNMATITTVNLTNCAAGSMTGNAGGTNLVHVYPINIDRSSASFTHTIDGCLIGSLSTPYSIQSTIATATTHNIHGIRLAPATSQPLNCIVKNTKIVNLGFPSGTAGSQLVGIIAANTSSSSFNPVYTITGNEIYNLTNTGANVGTGSTSSVQGIIVNGSNSSIGHNVSSNSIYNLSNTAVTSSPIQVFGINMGGGATTGAINVVSKNKIYDLSVASTSTTSLIQGIFTSIGLSLRIYNNMISLGNGLSNSPIIVGIDKSGGTVSAYHNTVRILGSPTANAVNTFAFRRTSSNLENVRSNIFINERSNSGTSTGKHYAISLQAVTSIVLDYNDYYASGTGGVLGVLAGIDYPTLLAWQGITFQDAFSKSIAVTFASPTDLHLAGSSIGDPNLQGVNITGVWSVLDDIDGDPRQSPPLGPYMGADENSVPLPVELKSFTANVVKGKVVLNWQTISEVNSYSFEVERKSVTASWTKIGEVAASGNSNSLREYSFIDKNSISGKLEYRLRMIDADGRFKYSDAIEAEISLPTEFSLGQNYPNPFNPSTKINYQLPFDSKVTMELYGITGEKIATLISSDLSAGYYTADINASALNLTSGVYIYRMVAIGGNNQTFTQVKKLMLTK